jgi:hypothetical protein
LLICKCFCVKVRCWKDPLRVVTLHACRPSAVCCYFSKASTCVNADIVRMLLHSTKQAADSKRTQERPKLCSQVAPAEGNGLIHA